MEEGGPHGFVAGVHELGDVINSEAAGGDGVQDLHLDGSCGGVGRLPVAQGQAPHPCLPPWLPRCALSLLRCPQKPRPSGHRPAFPAEPRLPEGPAGRLPPGTPWPARWGGWFQSHSHSAPKYTLRVETTATPPLSTTKGPEQPPPPYQEMSSWPLPCCLSTLDPAFAPEPQGNIWREGKGRGLGLCGPWEWGCLEAAAP